MILKFLGIGRHRYLFSDLTDRVGFEEFCLLSVYFQGLVTASHPIRMQFSKQTSLTIWIQEYGSVTKLDVFSLSSKQA